MQSTRVQAQQEAVEALLDAAKRKTERVNIRTAFVQSGPQKHPVHGPLHLLVRNHDDRALDPFLLHRALVSSAVLPTQDGEPRPLPEWTCRPLPSAAWARMLGIDNTPDHGASAVSKVWARLNGKYRLVDRHKVGRSAVFTSLHEDGSGDPYDSPDGKTLRDRYFTIPFAYWTDGWYRRLKFPAEAMLLICSTLAPGFTLPTERARPWYGVSTETAERGLRELCTHKLLGYRIEQKPTPLAARPTITERRYTIRPPFGRPTGTPTAPRLTVVGGTAERTA